MTRPKSKREQEIAIYEVENRDLLNSHLFGGATEASEIVPEECFRMLPANKHLVEYDITRSNEPASFREYI